MINRLLGRMLLAAAVAVGLFGVAFVAFAGNVGMGVALIAAALVLAGIAGYLSNS